MFFDNISLQNVVIPKILLFEMCSESAFMQLTNKAFATPLRVRCNDHFSARILIAVVDVQFQRTAVMVFYEIKQILTFMQNRIWTDHVVRKWTQTYNKTLLLITVLHYNGTNGSSPASSAGEPGWTSMICHTLSLATSKEQNRMLIPRSPCPPHASSGTIWTSRRVCVLQL